MRRNGQATVELALSMLLIVPIFLYTLFLEDLLRHKLTAQESALSTPWDFHGLNYERFNRGNNVDSTNFNKDQARQGRGQTVQPCAGKTAMGCYARWMWCDHTSAYNSYDVSYECNDDRHHTAVSAHACWVQPGAQQVACGSDEGTAADYLDPVMMIGALKDEVHRGGEMICSSRVSVLNYFLPQKIFSSFSNVDTTRTEKLAGSVHGNYNQAATDVYTLTMDRFSVVHDPWSQTTVQDIAPAGDGVLQDRTQAIYGSPLGLAAFGMSMLFLTQSMSDQLIGPQALLPADTPFSDNLMDANVAYRRAAGGAVDGYHTSPWRDWNNNPVQQTHTRRGRYYMGKQAEPN